MSLERLDWDSDFWQRGIYRATVADDLVPLPADCDSAWLLLPAELQSEIHHAELVGAHVMDIRVQYVSPVEPNMAIFRPAGERDIEDLAKIARVAFRGLTRFYADPAFEDDLCDDLYEGWFRQNVADPLVDVLMVGDGNGPAGFVTVQMRESISSIVLIAVAERAKGLGMGVNLAKAAIEWSDRHGIDQIDVVTQGCNIPAQRTFQRAGFALESTGIWLHK